MGTCCRDSRWRNTLTAEHRHCRRPVVSALKTLKAFSVENGHCFPGTPDVCYVGGWIELKELDKFPVRPTTPVRVRHFTPEQRAWHVSWEHHGGVSWVLLKVGKFDWLLFRGTVAADILGRTVRSELESAATLVMKSGLNKEMLLRCLQTTKT